jgi:hypothetical protein
LPTTGNQQYPRGGNSKPIMDTKSRTRLYFRFEREKTGFGLGHWPYSGNTQPETSSAYALNA